MRVVYVLSLAFSFAFSQSFKLQNIYDNPIGGRVFSVVVNKHGIFSVIKENDEEGCYVYHLSNGVANNIYAGKSCFFDIRGLDTVKVFSGELGDTVRVGLDDTIITSKLSYLTVLNYFTPAIIIAGDDSGRVFSIRSPSYYWGLKKNLWSKNTLKKVIGKDPWVFAIGIENNDFLRQTIYLTNVRDGLGGWDWARILGFGCDTSQGYNYEDFVILGDKIIISKGNSLEVTSINSITSKNKGCPQIEIKEYLAEINNIRISLKKLYVEDNKIFGVTDRNKFVISLDTARTWLEVGSNLDAVPNIEANEIVPYSGYAYGFYGTKDGVETYIVTGDLSKISNPIFNIKLKNKNELNKIGKYNILGRNFNFEKTRIKYFLILK